MSENKLWRYVLDNESYKRVMWEIDMAIERGDVEEANAIAKEVNDAVHEALFAPPPNLSRMAFDDTADTRAPQNEGGE